MSEAKIAFIVMWINNDLQLQVQATDEVDRLINPASTGDDCRSATTAAAAAAGGVNYLYVLLSSYPRLPMHLLWGQLPAGSDVAVNSHGDLAIHIHIICECEFIL